VGGGSIETRGTSQVRLATAAAALGLAAVLAIVFALGSSDRAAWLWGFGAVGILATLVALAGWAGATWWGVVALGAEYAVLHIGRGAVDVGAAVVATGLLILAELVMWSLDARSRVVNEAEVTERRLIRLGFLSLGTLVLGSSLVAVGTLTRGGAFARTVAGVVCSIGVLAVVTWASVRQRSRDRLDTR
jgi:hypothetical protein